MKKLILGIMVIGAFSSFDSNALRAGKTRQTTSNIAQEGYQVYTPEASEEVAFEGQGRKLADTDQTDLTQLQKALATAKAELKAAEQAAKDAFKKANPNLKLLVRLKQEKEAVRTDSAVISAQAEVDRINKQITDIKTAKKDAARAQRQQARDQRAAARQAKRDMVAQANLEHYKNGGEASAWLRHGQTTLTNLAASIDKLGNDTATFGGVNVPNVITYSLISSLIREVSALYADIAEMNDDVVKACALLDKSKTSGDVKDRTVALTLQKVAHRSDILGHRKESIAFKVGALKSGFSTPLNNQGKIIQALETANIQIAKTSFMTTLKSKFTKAQIADISVFIDRLNKINLAIDDSGNIDTIKTKFVTALQMVSELNGVLFTCLREAVSTGQVSKLDQIKTIITPAS